MTEGREEEGGRTSLKRLANGQSEACVKLDTGGQVILNQTRLLWTDLDPFTQGYVEAQLEALETSLRLPRDTERFVVDGYVAKIYVRLDSGRLARRRPKWIAHWGGWHVYDSGWMPLAANGWASYCGLTQRGFRHLAPETLAAILTDCEFSHSFWCMPRDAEAGRRFWELRQREPASSTFPPLTAYLGDDGKVYLRPLSAAPDDQSGCAATDAAQVSLVGPGNPPSLEPN